MHIDSITEPQRGETLNRPFLAVSTKQSLVRQINNAIRYFCSCIRLPNISTKTNKPIRSFLVRKETHKVPCTECEADSNKQAQKCKHWYLFQDPSHKPLAEPMRYAQVSHLWKLSQMYGVVMFTPLKFTKLDARSIVFQHTIVSAHRKKPCSLSSLRTPTHTFESKVKKRVRYYQQKEVPGSVGALTQTNTCTRTPVPGRSRRIHTHTHTHTYSSPRSRKGCLRK